MASRTEKDLPEETTVKGTSNVNLLDSWPPATIFRSRKMSFKLPLKPEPSANELGRAEELVNEKSQAFHDQVYAPAKDQFHLSLERSPLPTLFATLFLALAFFPSLAFLCFAAVLGATLLLTAAFWFLVISGLAVMIFLVVLTGCLIIASTVSLWGAALWLTYRLLLNIKHQHQLSDGIQATIQDARRLFITSSPKPMYTKVDGTTLDGPSLKDPAKAE